LANRAKPLPLAVLSTYSLRSRKSKVDIRRAAKVSRAGDSIGRFLRGLPDVLAAAEFRDLAGRMAAARAGRKALIWALGAHVIKVGLNPVLVDLMRTGWISALALNGAGIIHDFELAFAGRTSEDVESAIRTGRFGMARETGEFLNGAVTAGAAEGLGLGEAVGRMIARSRFPYRRTSLLGEAWRLKIPVTVHVALGTDIIHMHPAASGAAIGEASLRDFRLFAAQVAALDGGGVYLNIGSAVLLPEVFLKAVSLVRNSGLRLDGFSTAVFDFNHHYRPAQNVVKRPLGRTGKGYYFLGHHEIMVPLLAAALKNSRR
jgi:hypothetical protein